MRTYHLFISHSWTYSNSYEGIESFLKDRSYFGFKNYSVPKDDPIHTRGTDKELYEAILRRIKLSSAVLILAGVYATYSKWINKEIDIAKSLEKPIIAIQPWGSERTSQVVKVNANQIVKWNTESVVSAIRDLA